MKKKFLVVLLMFLVMFVVGCGKTTNSDKPGKKGLFDTKKTMTCVKEETDEDGLKTKSTMKITYNSKKVYKVDSIVESDLDPDYGALQESLISSFIQTFNNIDGISAKSSSNNGKITLEMDIDYDKINVEQIKEVLGDLYDEEDSIYDKKDYTIEEFKADNLEGYTCD